MTLYLFAVGMGVAGFTAVILEFMGNAGRSGSTGYSIINSLGNLPVQYMVLADNWGGDRFGVPGVAGNRMCPRIRGDCGLVMGLSVDDRRSSWSAPSRSPLRS